MRTFVVISVPLCESSGFLFFAWGLCVCLLDVCLLCLFVLFFAFFLVFRGFFSFFFDDVFSSRGDGVCDVGCFLGLVFSLMVWVCEAGCFLRLIFSHGFGGVFWCFELFCAMIHVGWRLGCLFLWAFWVLFSCLAVSAGLLKQNKGNGRC